MKPKALRKQLRWKATRKQIQRKAEQRYAIQQYQKGYYPKLSLADLGIEVTYTIPNPLH